MTAKFLKRWWFVSNPVTGVRGRFEEVWRGRQHVHTPILPGFRI
jgi:hypothetical protein